MATTFSVDVKSRFRLLIEDGSDDSDAENVVVKAIKKAKELAVNEKKEKALKSKSARNTAGESDSKNLQKVLSQAVAQPERVPVYIQTSKSFQTSSSRDNFLGSELRNESRPMSQRGRGAIRGNFRGRGFQNSSNFAAKREFDRHSGSNKTSVKPMDKREGRGAYNWGVPKDELRAQEDLQNLSLASVAASEPELPEAQPTENANVDNEKAEEVPEQPAIVKTMTLEEYKKSLGLDSTKVKNRQVRKANDGVNVFNGLEAYRKAHSDEDDADDSDENDEETERLRRLKEKQQNIVPQVRLNFAGSSNRRARFSRQPNAESSDKADPACTKGEPKAVEFCLDNAQDFPELK